MQLNKVTLFNSFDFCYLQHKNTIILNLKKTILNIKKQLILFNLLTKKFYYPIIICTNYIYNPINFINTNLPVNFLIYLKNIKLTNMYYTKFSNFNAFTLNDNFIVCLTRFIKPIKIMLPIISSQIQLTDYIINIKPYNFLANYFYLKCFILTINNKFLCK